MGLNTELKYNGGKTTDGAYRYFEFSYKLSENYEVHKSIFVRKETIQELSIA